MCLVYSVDNNRYHVPKQPVVSLQEIVFASRSKIMITGDCAALFIVISKYLKYFNIIKEYDIPVGCTLYNAPLKVPC